jgi:hypothetical protein
VWYSLRRSPKTWFSVIVSARFAAGIAGGLAGGLVFGVLMQLYCMARRVAEKVSPVIRNKYTLLGRPSPVNVNSCSSRAGSVPSCSDITRRPWMSKTSTCTCWDAATMSFTEV